MFQKTLLFKKDFKTKLCKSTIKNPHFVKHKIRELSKTMNNYETVAF